MDQYKRFLSLTGNMEESKAHWDLKYNSVIYQYKFFDSYNEISHTYTSSIDSISILILTQVLLLCCEPDTATVGSTI
jgi:hypothetical protein